MRPPRAARWRHGLLILGVVALAAALRLPELERRPMHADEAVHADKFGTLLEGGGYAYDPVEYHGPTLYYLTLVPAWFHGIRRYVDLDEAVLRAVPALVGVTLVAMQLAARGFPGWPAAALGALLAALSPAMVFYSRYAIHEMLLVFFSFGALVALWRLTTTPSAGWAALAGACAGLMLATKETAPLALAAMAVAILVSDVGRPAAAFSPAPRPRLLRGLLRGRDLLVAAVAAVLVASVFFSSFGAHPAGLVDAVRAYGFYLDRAGSVSAHIHPWDYYLRLLVHFPANGTPFWSEGLILLLAAAGAAAGWNERTSALAGADLRLLRYLAAYTALLLGLYCAIPYKTPWCLLGFLHGMILLAGAGAVFLVRALPGRAARAAAVALLAVGTAHLGWQAYAASFRFAADPRNPYVYAHTTNDVFRVVARLEALARAHPAGRAMPIQVIGRANLWPLPWSLRRFGHVEWWTGVSDEAPLAPVILATPDMEPALVRRLYDVPPPGERELYVPIFESPVELRPAVELRGYAANGLWQAFRQQEAEAQPRPEARSEVQPSPEAESRTPPQAAPAAARHTRS